jgi:formate dehydrogenase major subunit
MWFLSSKELQEKDLVNLGLQWPVQEDGTDTQILHTETFKLGKGQTKKF